MLLNSSFLCPAIGEIKGLSCDKTKISFSCIDAKKIKLSRRRDYQNSKIKAINKELEMSSMVKSGMGIGITNFFEGKNIFLTGGTGLLGKALVEKMLRSTPVGKIYVLVKADEPQAAMDRLQKELIKSVLFGCVQENHGKYYQEFIKEKLIPVVGNICEPNLGMDFDSAREIMEHVNVIIESAAVTTMNERYDLMLDTNVNGPQRLMRFAKTCKNLELFVHISTAFVNGEKEGIILEEPIIMGDNRRNHDGEANPSVFPRLDVSDEIYLALKSCKAASSHYDLTKHMKRLGMERARVYGCFNTYQLTKAMAEMVVHETRGDTPVLIIRPSVIESCYKQPYPGWIQGNRMVDPVITSYAKGQFPAFLGKPESHIDVIPLDMVVNTIIAAIAKHGYMGKSELKVYQVASDLLNPLRCSDVFEYIDEYFSSQPLMESENCTGIKFHDDLPKIKYFDNFGDFSSYTRDEIYRRLEMRNEAGIGAKKIDQMKLQKQCKAKAAFAEHLCKMYEFLGFFKARFHTGNTQNLLSEMSKEEKISFEIDVKEINWRKYFQEIHIPGLRKYVLHDKIISF